jgi:D-amino-acid dehydrogenase
MRREEPALNESVVAGFLLPEDSHVDPAALAAALRVAVEKAGGTVVEEAGQGDLLRSHDSVVGIRTAAAGEFHADEVVVAAGAGSARHLRELGIRVPMVSGKGYSFMVRPELVPRRALHLEEAHVACTPMQGGLRVAGTMELSQKRGINSRRVDAIAQAASRYIDGVSWGDRTDVWGGPRPVTSDGLPLIGRPAGVRGCVVATGHGMYGVTLAPTTGRLVAGIVAGGSASPSISPAR